MKNIFTSILGSFDNHSKGFSARKLTAFAFMMLIYYIHKYYLTIENSEYFLLVDCIMLLLLLSIITAEQVISFKNGQNMSKKEEPKTPENV